MILFSRYCFKVPPQTIKYDNRTKANTVIADGWWNHDGFLIFRWGTSRMENGILYRASIIEFEIQFYVIQVKIVRNLDIEEKREKKSQCQTHPNTPRPVKCNAWCNAGDNKTTHSIANIEIFNLIFIFWNK